MDPHLPALPIATEPDPGHVLVSEDGSVREHFNQIYSADDIERIRLGYCCIHCGESQVGHGAPMPEACWVCGYLMRDRQLARFAMEFVGEIRVGPSTSIEDELAIAEEIVARERKEKSTSSIVVPHWANV